MLAPKMLRYLAALFPLLCAACATAPAPAERALRSSDGARISYDVRGAGEPTLVFVHCWAGDRTFWSEQLDEFASEHRVVALDLAGHGRSEAHAQVSLDALAGDVVALCDELQLASVVFVGHSLGGPVALRTAALMPGRVAAVIGVETLHDVEMDVPREEVEKLLAAFEADWSGTMRQAVRSMLPRTTPYAIVERITSHAVATAPGPALAISRALLGTDLPKLLSGAGVPVRCINSSAHPPSILATNVEANRRHADFDAVLIQGTGHYPQLERSREFNRRLREQLASLRESPGPASDVPLK